MSLKLAKETSLRNKYACYGWIRETENILKLAQIVPSIVKVVCLLYFRDDEIFNDVIEKGGIQLSSNKKVLSLSDYDDKSSCNIFQHKICIYPCNNYGINEICSTQQTKIQWDLKVNDPTRGWWSATPAILFGIANKHDVDADRIHYIFQYQKIWISHGLCRFYHRNGKYTYSGKYARALGRHKQKIYDDGDRVSLHLDLKQKKIKVIVNGFDLGFTSVPIVTSPQIQYKFCVILHGGPSTVEILDFNIY